MRMTIDESERLLSNHLDGVTNYCERELTDKAIQVAIETMRKYQKIQEIVEHWACCGNPSDSMIAISEVLENGSK